MLLRLCDGELVVSLDPWTQQPILRPQRTSAKIIQQELKMASPITSLILFWWFLGFFSDHNVLIINVNFTCIQIRCSMDPVLVEDLVNSCCQAASTTRDSWQLINQLISSCPAVNQFFAPDSSALSKFGKSAGTAYKKINKLDIDLIIYFTFKM